MTSDRAPEKEFCIHVEGEFFLDVAAIWPDGDQPDEPTSEDVAALIKGLYGPWAVPQFLENWGLEELSVDVDGIPIWGDRYDEAQTAAEQEAARKKRAILESGAEYEVGGEG